MNSKQLKGLAVISIQDGEKLGTIDRVFIDADAKKVVGFGVGQGGGLLPMAESSEPELIDVDDVHAVGHDAVTLADKGAIRGDQTRAQLEGLMELDELIKLKVVTEGGTVVGEVASVEINDRGFAFRELEVSPGFFKSNRHLPIREVISIGLDLVVVDNAVIAEMGLDDGTSATDGDAGDSRFVVGDVRPSS